MSIEHTRAIMERYWAGHASDTITEDADFTDVASGRTWHGRNAIIDMLQTHYEGVFEAEFTPDATYIADGAAAVEGRFVGTHVGTYAGIEATGKEVDIPLAVFYTVGPEGITSGRVWFMVNRFLDQVT